MDLKEHGCSKLAVLPFKGDGSGKIAAMLQGALAEWRYYDLVERRDLKKVIDELALHHKPLFDSETAARVGKMAGASHALLGDVISCSARLSRETRYRTVKVKVGTSMVKVTKSDGSSVQVPVPRYVDRREPYTHYTMNVNVSVTFRVVDVETAEIVYSKNVSRSFNRGSSNRSALPTQSGILSELGRQVCGEFRLKICPYVKRVTQRFLKSDSKVDESEDDVDRALKLIRAGDLEGAEEPLRRGLERDPSHAAACFNLAMLFGLQGRVEQAREYALKAVRLEPDNGCIIRGREWIESLPR